jgi:hypothetical protein
MPCAPPPNRSASLSRLFIARHIGIDERCRAHMLSVVGSITAL